MGLLLPCACVGKKAGHTWQHWHALDENEHIRANIAFPKTVLSHPGAALNFFARAHTRDAERGDSKLPLGIALPLVACACFEIKHPNMHGSVLYSICKCY